MTTSDPMDGPAQATAADWPHALYQLLKQAGVSAAAYVPDAGHSRLIALLEADPEVDATVLTTEEEGSR